MARRKTKKILSLLLGLVILAVAAWHYLGDRLPIGGASETPAAGEGVLTAYFLDVDQGDCSLFVLPDGKTLLVDAGNRGDGEEIADYLSKLDITRLDYIIATHPHADHIGGMREIIDQLEVGKVFAPRIAADDIPTTKSYEDFLRSVQSKGLRLTAAKAGEQLFAGEDYRADCLAPTDEDYDNLNNYSVCLKLTYGLHSFVLTGDAERDVEATLLDKNKTLACDVFKVAHHGSSDSNSAAFLKALAPKYAVISCGADNSYGHPHRETLAALEGLVTQPNILRTDKEQTICITADGKTADGLTVTTGLDSVIE